MSLEIRTLYEPACPLYVCQHHHMGDFPFHPFNKQERFLMHWDKTFFFFFFLWIFQQTVNMSIFNTSRKQVSSTRTKHKLLKASNNRASCAWDRSTLLALDEAGLSKPTGRTVPRDGCNRPNQIVISGQQNAQEAAEIEAGVSCPCWAWGLIGLLPLWTAM